MNPYNYSRGPPPAGAQSGWSTNPNMYSMPVQYGANPSQYVQPQPHAGSSGFYPQQPAGVVQGRSPILARNQYQQQPYQQQVYQQQQFQQQPPLQQTNFHPIQQQPNYRGQPYQQQPYQQSYQQGYQQQPLQQHQQFHQSNMSPFQQQSVQPPGQPPPQPVTQIDPAVARRQQEKMIRDAQKKKEFEEQKQKLRSIVVGAPVVNPVDALFGKPPSAVKKQPTVEEPPKDEQEARAQHNMQPMVSTSLQQEKEKVEEPLIEQQLENVAESPSVDQLLSESLKTLDLKKDSPKVKKFQQSSFQKHKSQGTTSKQTTFVSSKKARNWSSVDELSDIFSEADEFTQFEAAPIQQGNQVTNLMMSSNQPQLHPQQHFNQETHDDDEFGTFQSISAQPVPSATGTSNQQQTNTQMFAAFAQVTTTISSQLPPVIGQQMTGPAPSDDFGMFQSTVTPSLLPISTTQQPPNPQQPPNTQQTPNTQQGGNRDSFGDFQTGTNDATITPMILTGQHHAPTVPVTSGFPYWQCSIDQLPKLYQDVFNTCIMADQFLDTQRLFPILSSSGLQRSLLRDMWSTVNQVQLGKLTKEEFCQILGLIALAQSGVSNPSLLELSKQTHPPVPQLVLEVNDQHKNTTSAKEIGASSSNTVNNEGGVTVPAVMSSAIHTSVSSSALIQDSDSKYDVFKTIPEPSSSTLAFSETIIPAVDNSDKKYDVFKVMSEASNPPLAVDDSSSKYNVFKMTSNSPSVETGFHANDVPKTTSSTDHLTSANQPLLASASHPLIPASEPPSASQLLTSVSQPLTLMSQPMAPASQPLTSINQPLTLTSQPLASMSQPLTSINPPLTSASQPLASTSQPLTSINPPFTSESQPLASTSQSLTSINPPFTSASQSLASATSTSQPVQDSSFEFGDFQGSSTEQQVGTSTSDNWASFESAFNSNVPSSTLPISQNTTTQEAFTATTVSVSTYTSGPSQFAVFDEANFPPTNTSAPVSNDNSIVPNHPDDKYSVFDAVRSDDPTASTAGNEDSEFGQFEMGQPPTNSQDAAKVEHYSTQMEILEKCLKACDNTLSTAADLLSEVKERKVLNELFNSTPGVEKAQGYFEIFKLAKRVASTALQLDGEAFTNIKKQWKKIVQAFPPGLLTKLSTSGNSPSVKPRSVNHNQRCSICGFGNRVSIPGDALYHRDLFTQGETAYHVICANMWSHLISKELPVCSQT